ncbi:hypothetical protein B0H10DRAFT_1909668 [Mycena sp. CBHHK59/15]|nr:hypothetical protein B0H10DRAFT_1909668 [Mycena sp. CBHHK59/15]
MVYTQRSKDSFVFDTCVPTKRAEQDPPDTPSTMLLSPVRPAVRSLTPKDKETIFWQARGHDGCFKCVALLQHFFDLYPYDTLVRVRTADGTGFATPASSHTIRELVLLQPKLITFVVPGAVVLDLASMQFGNVGRGLGGRSTFVLESRDTFSQRLRNFAGHSSYTKTSQRIRGCPDDEWLRRVAKHVEGRLEKQEAEPWCGHCGGPI